MLVSDKIDKYRTVYALNAIFLSGTIDETFRPDLTHYKFIPESRMRIYWTDGMTPDFKTGLYFVERAKALIRNYPNNSIVGRQSALENNFTNFDPHSHTGGKVFSTSAMREGISITTGTYEAVVVPANLCPTWSNKDKIQAVNRVRGDDVVRLVTTPMVSKPRSKMTTSHAVKIIKGRLRQQDSNVTAVEASLFNDLIRMGTTDGFSGVCPYGVACFMAMINRNNIDEELYELVKYTEQIEEFQINTKTVRALPDVNNMMTMESNGKLYTFAQKYERRMLEWFDLMVEMELNTIIPKLMKLKDKTSLNNFYMNGSVAKKMKYMYSSANRNRKYNREKFIKDIGKIVDVKIFNVDGMEVKRLNKNTDYKTLQFKVVAECPVPCKIELKP